MKQLLSKYLFLVALISYVSITHTITAKTKSSELQQKTKSAYEPKFIFSIFLMSGTFGTSLEGEIYDDIKSSGSLKKQFDLDSFLIKGGGANIDVYPFSSQIFNAIGFSATVAFNGFSNISVNKSDCQKYLTISCKGTNIGRLWSRTQSTIGLKYDFLTFEDNKSFFSTNIGAGAAYGHGEIPGEAPNLLNAINIRSSSVSIWSPYLEANIRILAPIGLQAIISIEFGVIAVYKAPNLLANGTGVSKYDISIPLKIGMGVRY